MAYGVDDISTMTKKKVDTSFDEAPCQPLDEFDEGEGWKNKFYTNIRAEIWPVSCKSIVSLRC